MFFSGIRSNLSLALLCTTSALALSTAAQAQDNNAETVVVTGSRVIADAANSPTPLTIVTTAQLQVASPTNIATALNKLPEFAGSSTGHTTSSADANYGASALNLRGFGAARTLTLFDGHRVAPSNVDGTVDIESLPQMLMQRVDVVTGGASAVYGSDAVTGVVNFVLDKHFTGIKIDVNAGISTYSDGASYNAGIAAGSDLFGGRGHFEGDLRVQHMDVIQDFKRPLDLLNPMMVGAGTAASPLYTQLNGTINNFAPGGLVTCTCAANGQQFITNNTLGPFNPGQKTPNGSVNVGGDGSTGENIHTFQPQTQNEEAFGRFSYNLNDSTTFYIQGTVVENFSKAIFVPWYIQTGSAANTYFANNAYLTPTAQAALASGNPTGQFQSVLYLNKHLGTWDGQLAETREANRNGTTGIDGTIFGKYNYSVYYTHGDDRLKIDSGHNPNRQYMWAANDAVAGPNGTVQCYVSTTTYASLYPGCVPIDPFGPNTLTANQYNYVSRDTYFIEENKLDNVGGSISGAVFDDWAGPVTAALSMEARWNSLSIFTNSQATELVDCTGLRLCNTTSALWQGKTASRLPQVSMNVWEVAGEVNVPLLKNVPLVQDLSVDLAGRYTSYSTTGSVETWKIGLDYHVNDEVRFRATNSVDIRAPSLYDLYGPVTSANGGYQDIHTSSASIIPQQSQGNPNLTPEIARTYTGGVVYTPEFIPNFTLSVDFYQIHMTNVISSINATVNSVQLACEQSGGSSPFCALYARPLPFSNTTTFNYPTKVFIQSLNSAFQNTEGYDIELNYGFQLADVWADAPGAVNLRMIANIRPVMESQPYQGAPVSLTSVSPPVGVAAVPSSKGRVTSFVSYDVGSWNFTLTDRWLSNFPRATYIGQVYTLPSSRINSVNYQDITIDKKFKIDGQTVDGYFSVQNVGNILPPINLADTPQVPGDFYQGISNSGSLSTYDPIGRYFTLGVRANF